MIEVEAKLKAYELRPAILRGDIISQIRALEKQLPARQMRRLIREIQYELSASWKFFAGIARDRSALVLADAFTALPLSLARNCAQVGVHGLTPQESAFLRCLAEAHGIANLEILSELEELDTKPDLLVSLLCSNGSLAQLDIAGLMAENTELWFFATNRMSGGYAKEQLGKRLGSGTEQAQKAGGAGGFRFPFGVARPPAAAEVKALLKKQECARSVEIFLTPTFIDAKTAYGRGNGSLSRIDSSSQKARFRSEELVVGGTRKAFARLFLPRLIAHLETHGLNSGKIESYYISPGGKVLAFAAFRRNGRVRRAIIKLPMNGLSGWKVEKNYDFLQLFHRSADISKNRRMFFPQPLAEGAFENQPYFIEERLSGRSGDMLRVTAAEKERLIYEIYTFWLGVQKSFARTQYFDEATFATHVAGPVEAAFAYFQPAGEATRIQEKALAFLREQLSGREHVLSLIHGDFSDKNIIYDDESVILRGLIDWDMAQLAAFPVLDALHYFVRLQDRSSRRGPVTLLADMLSKRRKNRAFSSIIELYAETFSFDPDLLPAMLFLYWACRIHGHLRGLKFLDRAFVKRNFAEPLDVFAQLIG